MIYVIDHKDSFTHNVVHQFSLFDEVECDNFNKIDKKKLNQASTIVFSPGPGSPKDYPITSKIYKKYKRKKRIIGICLGFQQILFSEGAQIVHQKKIYHGFQSEILVNKSSKLFKAGSKFKVGRYHSLKLKEPFRAENFDITMRCVISGAAMSFENNIDKIYGFQFHPESFLTLNGKLLIKKILSA
jgi:anthranilate synthase component 2/para-aminobenzoate synthetase component 2